GAGARPPFQRGRAVAGWRGRWGDRHVGRRGDDREGDRFALARRVAQRARLGGLGGVGAFGERRARTAGAPFPERGGGRGAGQHRVFGFACGVDVDRHFGEVGGGAAEGGGGVLGRGRGLVEGDVGRGRVDREGGRDALAVAGFVALAGLGGVGAVSQM